MAGEDPLQIDVAVSALGDGDGSARDSVAVGRRTVADESGEW
jgi:hypothetical protein